jgi:nucleoid DNA-binding protein
MSLGKKDIIKNISSKALISNEQSSLLLELFLNHIRSKSKSSIVKISGFGSFLYKRSPSRLGRNPKTKENFNIPAISKLHLRPSSRVKNILN